MYRKLLFSLLLPVILLSLSCGHGKDSSGNRGKADSAAVLMNEKARHDTLAAEISRFLKDPCFRSAIVGYVIYDFTKGLPKVIFEHNGSLGMTPASTQKILTTAAALEIFGEPIFKEVTVTNLFSVNWRANRLMQKIGQEKYGKYDFLHGSQAVMEYWEERGIDTRGLNLIDGSGRSHDNIATPRLLAEVLFKMTTSSVFPVFYNSLPLAGISGTMHKWLVGSCGEGRIRAKTGSLGGVRSYAGYVRTLSGKKLIFTLIINNYGCRTKVLKAKVEELMIGMVRL
ncbi:MAG: D-alanyl-D-alanine carboxypeptidase [Bacteroidetes bacterium]|nr:D-alanyl-D-alanine carboxypeptidase [Bacteroidota bacterium]